MKRIIKVGTRKSLLALKQTEMAVNAIKSRFPHLEFQIVGISTKGDRNLSKPLGEIGDKGLFVSEIEKMIKEGDIDFAVHSGKDLPLELYGGLEISGGLSRDDRRDFLVTVKNRNFENSRKIIGTGSKRRALQCSKIIKDGEFKLIRGNINTRLEKLYGGEYDAVILAAAGLHRLDLYKDERFEFRPFKEEEMVPAACQGIIVLEARENSEISEIIREIQCSDTRKEFEAERYILKALGGDCNASIGASVKYSGGKLIAALMYGEKKVYFETDEENFSITADKYIEEIL